ncbi:hypothetical protein E0Z10_g10669, partial [Xylaria hypoxylon]
GVQKPEKRKKTAYQEFTAREMKALSVSHKGLSFKEKMVMVSARWSKHQSLIKSKAKSTGADDRAEATAVSVKGLATAIEVLEIGGDNSDDDGCIGVDLEKKAAHGIFA